MAEVKQWSVGRKKEVVLRLLRGEPRDRVSCEAAVPIYKIARLVLVKTDTATQQLGDSVRRNIAIGQAVRNAGGHVCRNQINCPEL